jgi:hypothetical protein
MAFIKFAKPEKNVYQQPHLVLQAAHQKKACTKRSSTTYFESQLQTRLVLVNVLNSAVKDLIVLSWKGVTRGMTKRYRCYSIIDAGLRNPLRFQKS